MWELSESPTTQSLMSTNTQPSFPTSFICRLSEYMNCSGLKVCRLVCKQWNNAICKSSCWTTRTVGVIAGQSTSIFSSFLDCPGSTCAAYLDCSKVRFRYWSHLRIRNIKSCHLSPLLTHHASKFGRAVKHVQILELDHCSFTWMDFLELLYLFRGLEKLTITKSLFGWNECGIASKFMAALGLVCSPHFDELVEDFGSLCPPEDYFFGNLKELHIQEDDDQDKMMTPLLLTLLKDRTPLLDKFSILLGRSTVQLREPEDQNTLWQSVHAFLCQKNVIQCRIESFHLISSGMVNRFFTYLSIWKFPPKNSEIWRMQKLRIHLRPLILWGSFERHLIPLVQRFPCLKHLSLQHIILRGNRAYLVRGLMEQCPDACALQVGLILDDQGGFEAANLEKELLSSELYRRNLVSIEAVVYTDATRELRDMIPYQKKVTFPGMQSFSVTTNGVSRPRFFTFNINVVVHNFPNLTELSLVDGPPLRVGSLFSSCRAVDSVWKDMSGAVVCDDDIQLILKNLTKLVKLVIRANMKYVTDSGFTGFSIQYCRRWPKFGVLRAETRQKLEHLHRDGVSFGSLQSIVSSRMILWY